MADTYTPEERRALAAFTGPVQRVETRTPEQIVAAGYEVSRGSSWGHDKQHPIKAGQASARRRQARLAKFGKWNDRQKLQGVARARAINKLIAEGLTTREIAARTGSTPDAVRSFCKKAGISLRRRR